MKCFLAVFPSQSEEQLENAAVGRIDGWDSIASVTLFSLIEEEFTMECQVQDLASLNSFENILAYLRKRQIAVERS
jgi:acyl carrier protein